MTIPGGVRLGVEESLFEYETKDLKKCIDNLKSVLKDYRHVPKPRTPSNPQNRQIKQYKADLARGHYNGRLRAEIRVLDRILDEEGLSNGEYKWLWRRLTGNRISL